MTLMLAGLGRATRGRANSRPADLAAALAGLAALALLASAISEADAPAMLDDATQKGERVSSAQPSEIQPRTARGGREVLVGGYSGVSHTHQSEVTIRNPGRTDMSVKGFGWMGQPFKSPIYYGLRALSWTPDRRFGLLLDFTHAKAIARFGDEAAFAGTREGRPVAPKAKVGDVFKHLEFSHGHNLVTLNGLVALALPAARIRPYVGLGGGVALPHTEIGFRDEPGRTYEYQFAGFVGQLLAGVEIRLGRASVFFEYKFTYAPMHVPLSQEPLGWLLVTDIWRQLKAALAGEQPPGGTLRTTLLTQHGIGGALVRVTPSVGTP